LGFNELSTPVKAIVSLGLVLVLVVIAGLLLRRIAGGRLKLPGQGSRARQPRLGVVDIFELDRQRQLILLRRDNVEHLVMIGGPNDLVVEASIVRSGARAAVPPPLEPAEAAALPQEPRLPTPPPRAVQPPPPRPPEPVPLPVTAPAPPRREMAPMVAAGLAGAAAQPRPEPQPARPSFEDDIAASFEAEIAKMTVSAEAPRSASADDTASPPPAEDSAPAGPAEFGERTRPILEPIAPPPMARASQVELDDMTRQLQEALARPFSGVKPATQIKASAKPEDGQPPRAMTESAPEPEPAPAIAVKAAPARLETVIVKPRAPEPAPPVEPLRAETGEGGQNPQGSPAARTADGEVRNEASIRVEPPQEALVEPTRQEAAGQEAARQEKPAPEAVLRPQPKPSAPAGASPASPEPKRSEAPESKPAPVEAAPKPPAVAPEAVKPPPAAAPANAAATQAPAKQPAAAPAAQPPAPASPSVAQPVPDQNSDPFSVDAIEAEFARLLNRSAGPKS
jgi:hypothetical protein